MDPDSRPRHDEAPAPDFPGEAEWLTLEPPAVHPDFVATTLRLVMAGAAPVDHDANLDEPVLPTEALRQFEPPPPSPAFVLRTLQALRSERQARWRALLLRYVVPVPSPDFVARTLAALRVPAGMSRRWRTAARLAVGSLVTAAAILLAVALWGDRGPRGLDRAIAESLPELRASTWAPSALPALLVHVRARTEPEDLPAGEADGAFVLLRAATSRGSVR
jgi:hypothetical protein